MNPQALAEALGVECAMDAYNYAQQSQAYQSGDVTLPEIPYQSDYEMLWQEFMEQFDRAPTNDEEHLFEEAYAEEMSDAVQQGIM